MKLKFETIKDFEDYFNTAYIYDKCSCGGFREMGLSNETVIIDEHEIIIIDCPVLVCQKCDAKNLGNLVPREIYKTYLIMQKNNALGCRLTTLNNQKFQYAEKANFNYDCRDLNIPGLNIDADPFHTPGFSCPVYFDRKVLNNFFTDDDYNLDFFSESYGCIAKRGTNGWDWEWNVVFGINQNNKVIMFLGDLNQIDNDDRAIMWLKSYNIDSDHVIVDTELYQAQLNCQFSEPIIERRILKLRNAFYKQVKIKHEFDLFHLEVEVETMGNNLAKPVNYSERELRENIVILDGLLNEGIDCDELRKLYVKFVKPLPSDYLKLKTRKLLQGIIGTKAGNNAAKDIISPLFYLNDLRGCFSHLLPQKTVASYKENIVKAFGLNSFDEYQKVYDILIEKLYKMYQYLNLTDF